MRAAFAGVALVVLGVVGVATLRASTPHSAMTNTGEVYGRLFSEGGVTPVPLPPISGAVSFVDSSGNVRTTVQRGRGALPGSERSPSVGSLSPSGGSSRVPGGTSAA